MLKTLIALLFIASSDWSFAQDEYIISGKVVEVNVDKPLPNATIHLKGSNFSTLSKIDGSFRIHTNEWYDSLEVSCIGFSAVTVALAHSLTKDIIVVMQPRPGDLQAVVIGISRRPGKSFMQKVIEQKNKNNPSRFRSYVYQRYGRNELDIDNMDFSKTKGSGVKSLLLKTFSALDSTAKKDRELPIYFEEILANHYHSVSPDIEQENIMAKKNLGLKTDAFLGKLGKFSFHFNVYDDWLPVFDQSYVSPLNSNAFSYYQFFEGDSLNVNDEIIQQIRFVPQRSYERAFTGNLWINKNTLAVETVVLQLNKTANLNFIKDINYTEDYKQVYDSLSDKLVYMPFKYSSDVWFESGLDLLGIPVSESKTAVRLIFKNTTVLTKINLSVNDASLVFGTQVRKEKTVDWYKPDKYWSQNRPDSLTTHEQNIYKMVDSLKENSRFQRDIKLIAFAGTGYWDFGKYLRLGPYSSFVSTNQIEGWRFRLGFWTMPAISKKMNIYGYGSYGTKDKRIKGLLGVKYIWDAARWTKTAFTYGSDYDFIIDQDDELDKDNIINSFLRKDIPFTRTYIKQVLLKHEQYISSNFSTHISFGYKELNPVFDFKYHPINPLLDKPYDSVLATRLPVAEATIGVTYAHQERTTILNYDRIRLGTFFPILSANYTYGFELGKAEFNFRKISVSVEQRLRLPPKSSLYYKVEIGKIFGTVPYLLLNVPAGNEYYVASRYQFNTMSPYEFAADRYISLHNRFYLGGALLDKIPFIRKLGWRERFSFNGYWGDMSPSNISYNKNSNFNVIGKIPFMEASAGIENIFHVISIEYYRRLSYLDNPYAKRDGVYLGLTLAF